jgi:hypothetical protein
VDEAINIYRTVMAHKLGAQNGIFEIERREAAAIVSAQADMSAILSLLGGGGAFPAPQVVNLESELQIAADRLLAEFVPVGASHGAISSLDIQISSPTGGTLRGLQRNGYVVEGNPNPGNVTPLDQNDLLIGQGGADTIQGLFGDDILVGGLGNDRLEGGVGNDLYIYRVGDGTDTISGDSDGTIYVNGVQLFGADATRVGNKWIWVTGAGTYVYTLETGDVAVGGTLVITGTGILAGDAIRIENWHPGDLGLNVPLTAQVALLAGLQVPPYGDPNYQPTTGSTTLFEHDGQTLTVALNRPALLNEKLRLSVTGLGNNIGIVTGDETLYFNGSYIDVTLRPGQSIYVISLISRGDVDTDTTFSLNAQLLDALETAVAPVASINVTFDAVDEDAYTKPTTFSSIVVGDNNEDLIVNQTTPGHVPGQPILVQSLGANDIIQYSFLDATQLLIEAGEGNDESDWIVMPHLLSPVKRVLNEAGRER